MLPIATIYGQAEAAIADARTAVEDYDHEADLDGSDWEGLRAELLRAFDLAEGAIDDGAAADRSLRDYQGAIASVYAQ